MKTKLVLISLIGLLTVDCKKETVVEGTPACISQLIEQIKAENKWEPPAKIFRYLYKGQVVYYIPQRCCDIPSSLVDEQCQSICSPDGGFTGRGDGKCPDFFTSRTEERLIWEDPR